MKHWIEETFYSFCIEPSDSLHTFAWLATRADSLLAMPAEVAASLDSPRAMQPANIVTELSYRVWIGSRWRRGSSLPCKRAGGAFTLTHHHSAPSINLNSSTKTVLESSKTQIGAIVLKRLLAVGIAMECCCERHCEADRHCQPETATKTLQFWRQRTFCHFTCGLTCV